MYEPQPFDPHAVVDHFRRAQDLLAGHLRSSVMADHPPTYQAPTAEEVTAALAHAQLAHAGVVALLNQEDNADRDAILTKLAELASGAAPHARLRSPW